MFGFYRFACVSPVLKVADTAYNTEEIIRSAKIAASNGAAFVVFPELSITGYTCSDLFHQELLLQNSTRALLKIAKAFSDSDTVIAVGLPLRIFGRLYNCAAFVQRGRVVAVTPKIHLPNQREFYEKRHFSSGCDLLRGVPVISTEKSADAVTCFIEGAGEVPVTNFFTVKGSEVRIGVELCEDLWTPAPPSGKLALAGANVIVNLSASDALVGKRDYRRNLVMNQSARCMAAYVYASAGVHESTTDMVFSGHLMIAENGSMLAESKPFSRETEIVYADEEILNRIGLYLLFFEKIERNILVFILFRERIQVFEHSACRAGCGNEFYDVVIFFVLVKLFHEVVCLVFRKTDNAFSNGSRSDQIAESKSGFELIYLIVNLFS